MSVGISIEELLVWNDDAAKFWRDHLSANPALLELPCGIGGAANVLQFLRHVWGAELRWAQRLAAQPVIDREKIPAGPLDALFDLHLQALALLRELLQAPDESWSQPYILDFDWVPPGKRSISRRKIAAHALLHGQRHYAQLATLVRAAGHPSGFQGDILFSPALP